MPKTAQLGSKRLNQDWYQFVQREEEVAAFIEMVALPPKKVALYNPGYAVIRTHNGHLLSLWLTESPYGMGTHDWYRRVYNDPLPLNKWKSDYQW